MIPNSTFMPHKLNSHYSYGITLLQDLVNNVENLMSCSFTDTVNGVVVGTGNQDTGK